MRKIIPRAVSVLLACASPFAHAAGCQTLSSDNLQARASAYKPLIHNAATQHGVSSSLVKAVITVESCFRPESAWLAEGKRLDATHARHGTPLQYSQWV
ncbi:hypothetical protein [Thiothrix subterranea]|uniref:hypothetical protein n=1 Tax=Thiothrix subterranea TaxID=2735563 RepID=UPI00280AAFBE|nr:hypothetical protein [Thiothrix subterranea]